MTRKDLNNWIMYHEIHHLSRLGFSNRRIALHMGIDARTVAKYLRINDIKQRLPILKLLAHYGIKADKNYHIRCPFHQDDKPSCKIYPETGTYHCFACGKTGDVIQFIQNKEGCTKHEAILKAKALINPVESKELFHRVNEMPTPATKAETPKESIMKEDFKTLFADQQKALSPETPSSQRSFKALEYIKQRGLEHVQEIGFNSGNKWKKLKQCITFPLKDAKGNIVSLYGRRITESNGYSLEYGKHYYSENRSGLYPCYPEENTEILIFTEAIIDAATLLQIPEITEHFKILSCYGHLAFVKEAQEAVKNLPKLKEVIIFFDGDQGGLDGIKHVSEIMQQIKPGVKITAVATPEKEDINSLYVKYDKDCLIQLINERKPVTEVEFFSSTEPNLIEKEISTLNHQQINTSPLDTTNSNKITYETQTARYIVKDGLPKQLDKMLISLDVQHLETALKYRCRLDLYEEKQTRREAREAAEKLDLRSDLVENDLSNLCDMLEEHRENGLETNNSKDNDPTPDLPTQAKCKDFLSKPELINRINELIGKSGITGEFNNRLFLFIIASSYKMPDTLHALIQGSSGSGKTHLLSKIAALMPPERVVKFTRVTENSFYNYDEFFFRNKLICLEDIDGLKEEALFAWRELISNNQLSSSTSQKDENGNIRSAQRIVRGPMASICATTHGAIYEDNMSRLFIIAVDESGEQTLHIMEYQSKVSAGLIKKDEEKEAREFLQNCIRMLKPLEVINPYADKIKLPPQAHKIRRLHELFLSFVKQITLIHQYQRKRDQQGRVITAPEDLKIAVEIMFDSIFLKVDELDGSLRQFFEQLKEYILQKENPQNYEFTQREVRQALNLSKTSLFRHLNSLIELEYISTSGGYQNRGLKYKISYWDNVTKLREQIKEYLNNQLDKL
jgi:DNA primase/DNA-binding MarR family transcriptional regulator